MNLHSRSIRILLLLCAAVLAVCWAISWSLLLPEHGFMQISPNGLTFAEARALPFRWRLVAMLVSLPSLAALGYGLWRLNAMLGNIARQAIFAAATIGHLRVFAGATLASVMLSILEPPLRTLLFRLIFDDHSRKLGIGVNSEHVMLILVCGLFYLITRLMQEARRVAEENEGFV